MVRSDYDQRIRPRGDQRAVQMFKGRENPVGLDRIGTGRQAINCCCVRRTRNDQRNLSALTMLSVLTRAREAGRRDAI